MNKERESMVEDALARVLWRAYSDARIEDDGYGTDHYDGVAADEEILREALFGPKPLNYRSTK